MLNGKVTDLKKKHGKKLGYIYDDATSTISRFSFDVELLNHSNVEAFI